MKRILMIACAAGALALAGCGSLPSDPSGWVIALDQGYHTYCGQAGHSAGCAAADQQKEHDLVQAALTGIADWQSGKITARRCSRRSPRWRT